MLCRYAKHEPVLLTLVFGFGFDFAFDFDLGRFTPTG
jgi:hypothetical protein